MDDPQVLLIGGPPGAGKTTLAEAVARELQMRWLPGDALVTAMRGVTTAESHPALHVVGPGRHVEYFTAGPPEKLVADARALQDAAWPGFARVIGFHARYGPSVVIDSWTFAPHNVAALGMDNVLAVWIVVDAAVLEERERPRPGYVDPSPDPQRRRDNFFHRSIWANRFIEEEATRLGLPILRQGGTETVADHATAVEELLAAPR